MASASTRSLIRAFRPSGVATSTCRADDVFYVEGEPAQVKERGLRPGRDQQINIAGPVGFIARHRAEGADIAGT